MAERAGGPAGPEWATEGGYWGGAYRSRPYYSSGREYGYQQPAYRYGFASAGRYRGRPWGEVAADPSRGRARAAGGSKAAWEGVEDAVRDAWDRVVHNR